MSLWTMKRPPLSRRSLSAAIALAGIAELTWGPVSRVISRKRCATYCEAPEPLIQSLPMDQHQASVALHDPTVAIHLDFVALELSDLSIG